MGRIRSLRVLCVVIIALFGFQYSLGEEHHSARWVFKKNDALADNGAPNSKICSSIMKRLKKEIPSGGWAMARERDELGNCAYNVVSNYPKLERPDWVELNINDYKSLVLKLFLFGGSIDSYFTRFDEKPYPLSPADSNFFEANKIASEKFIAKGGKIFVLRNPGLNIFKPFEQDAPNDQVLIRLEKLPSIRHRNPKVCPSRNGPEGDLVMMAFVTEDLKSIDVRAKATAFNVLGADLRIYDNSYFFISYSFSSIGLAYPEFGVVSYFCIFSYE